ncbi:hypothetical protein [Phytohabitans rumicis]|uniref:Mercuric ion transport protein n=1 Tax=Phytohabitans rumicis TaxID=1076125 RepID=A0A6V8LET2_9ACTN|nr:hypothetical protein [Phytohabitans rumicis]GFJ93468.1 hypothetical protein Prum_071100 [Phytohabitans rumicis]
MTLPTKSPAAAGHQPTPIQIDNKPPTRSKVTGALAALACAACCALPLLIAAGVLTGAGAGLLEKTLIAVAAILGAAALGMWWLHRRRGARAGCGTAGCDC